MPYVITRLCIDCVDKGCVEVCPVECIYEPVDTSASDRARQLYIHPTECINCGACEPECPWRAIYEDRELPQRFADDLAVNAEVEARTAEFVVAVQDRDAEGRLVAKPRPTPAQVAANEAKWSGR